MLSMMGIIPSVVAAPLSMLTRCAVKRTVKVLGMSQMLPCSVVDQNMLDLIHHCVVLQRPAVPR